MAYEEAMQKLIKPAEEAFGALSDEYAEFLHLIHDWKVKRSVRSVLYLSRTD